MTTTQVEDQSRRRVERTLTLIKLLSEAQRPLTRADIFLAMRADYPDDSDATKRKFERDKKTIKDVVAYSTNGESEKGEDAGYWIERDAMQESSLRLTAEEAAIVSIAIDQAFSGSEASRLHIGTAGLVGRSGHAGHARDYLRISPLPRQLQDLMLACITKSRVRFDYKKPQDSSSATRVLEVWGLIAHHGHWYAGGWDCEAKAVRVFRLDRIRSDVAKLGNAETPIDSQFDITREVIRERAHADHGLVLARAGKCQALRQRASKVTIGAQGWDELEFDCRDLDAAAGLIARFGADAKVVAPTDLRDRVIERLRVAAAGGNHG